MGGPSLPLIILMIVTLLPLIGVAGGCVPEQLVQGCRLEEGSCVCGLGCDTTFHYATRDQCQAAIKEKERDECESSPCKNGGVCSQISQHPGYQCLCANTGYYGLTCQNKCPRPENFKTVGAESTFHIDCVVI